MNKDISAGRKDPEQEDIPDPYMEINVRIAEAVGYIVEIQDGIAKAWSKFAYEDAPSEDNWVTVPDFVSSDAAVAELLENYGYQFFVKEEGGLYECAFQKDEHMAVTVKHITEGLALADAFLLVLEYKSQVT